MGIRIWKPASLRVRFVSNDSFSVFSPIFALWSFKIINLLHGNRMYQIRQYYKVFISPSYYFHKPCSRNSERRHDMSVLKYTRKYLLYNLIVLIMICGVGTLVYSQIRKKRRLSLRMYPLFHHPFRLRVSQHRG